MSLRRRFAFWGPAAAVLAVFFLSPSLEAQNGNASGEVPALPEPPLPSRIPEYAPPSPEMPLPDASGHLRQGGIQWSGEIDPDLSWIGSPWDHLPPLDQESTMDTAPRNGPLAPEAAPFEPPPPAAARRPATPPTRPGAPEAASDSPAPREVSPADRGSVRPPSTPALLGEIAAISLPGTGWIYVGAVPREADIDLVESQSGAGETLFRFRPRDPGDVLLSFQRQDMGTGSFEESTVLLSVSEGWEPIPEDVGDPAVPGGAGSSLEAVSPGEPQPERRTLEITTEGDGRYQEARGLLADGHRQEALESFLRHYDGFGSPELNQEIAALAIDLGYDEIAYHFWEQNLRLPSETGSTARRRLTERLVNTAPIRDLEDFLLLLEHHNEIPDAPLLLSWARSYDANGMTPDLRRAMLLYNAIRDWYPASREAVEAEQRLRFLRRHFLEIR